jgi:hypothetical protein
VPNAVRPGACVEALADAEYWGTTLSFLTLRLRFPTAAAGCASDSHSAWCDTALFVNLANIEADALSLADNSVVDSPLDDDPATLPLSAELRAAITSSAALRCMSIVALWQRLTLTDNKKSEL